MALGLYDVIKYQGDKNVIAWKHPVEDFNTKSVLVVNEGQVAILEEQGVFSDAKEKGTYQLSTKNFPFIREAIAFLGNGSSPYHYSVYFISLFHHLNEQWGVGGITYRIPVGEFSGIPVTLGLSGTISVSVSDPKQLLLKIAIGREVLDQRELMGELNGITSNIIKAKLANVIREEEIDVFEIDSSLIELSSCIKEVLQNKYTEYGVSIEEFTINAINKGDDWKDVKNQIKNGQLREYEANVNQKVAEINAYTEKKKTIIGAEAEKSKWGLLGTSHRQERAFDVVQGLANNSGVGGMSSMGAGLGMMSSAAIATGATLGRMLNNVAATIEEAERDEMMEGENEENKDIIDSQKSIDIRIKELEKLEEYVEKGLLDKELFQRKIEKILADI